MRRNIFTAWMLLSAKRTELSTVSRRSSAVMPLTDMPVQRPSGGSRLPGGSHAQRMR